MPKSGDKFLAFEDEKFAKKLATKKAFADKQNELNTKNITLQLQTHENKQPLNIIIKSDVQGTAEALRYSLSQLSNEDAVVNIVRYSSGSVSKSDILLARAANCIIFAFNLKIDAGVKALAEQEKVTIRTSSVIYEIIEEVKQIIKSYGAPEYEEVIQGEALIQKIFYYSKVGNIAGCLVTSGQIKANAKMRLFRAGKLIHEGLLETLQHGKDAIKKVENGREFGTHIKGFNEIAEGDVIQTYEDVLVTRS